MMKLSEDIRSISFVKAHASEVLADIDENRKTVVITQNGEAKAVLQDVHSYEETRESLALLQMLAQSEKDVADGRTKPFRQAFTDVRPRARQKLSEA